MKCKVSETRNKRPHSQKLQNKPGGNPAGLHRPAPVVPQPAKKQRVAGSAARRGAEFDGSSRNSTSIPGFEVTPQTPPNEVTFGVWAKHRLLRNAMRLGACCGAHSMWALRGPLPAKQPGSTCFHCASHGSMFGRVSTFDTLGCTSGRASG